jgi:hypothetical protein
MFFSDLGTAQNSQKAKVIRTHVKTVYSGAVCTFPVFLL